MRAFLLCAFLLGCSSKEQARVEQDTGVEEEDTFPALPPLDPSKCGAVAGDEAPLAFDPGFTFAPATLTEKLFPLFIDLEPEAARLIADSALNDLQSADEMRFAAAAACTDVACVMSRTSWIDGDITAAATATGLVFEGTTFVADRLRPSGAYNAYATNNDRELLVAAVVEHMKATRDAVAAFGPELDMAKMSAALVVARAKPGPVPFFHRTTSLAIEVLKASGRDQAALYEPLDKGENAAAIAAIPSIEWANYPFAANVIPGLGPTDDAPLAEGGRIRADLAAQRYAAKIAPLIVLSGGHVHPDRTKYSEAMEMKRYLVEKRAIPASAILVDPHARHTTTNLRNTSRLLLRYGVPPERPIVVTSDMFQTLYIVGRPFAVRCREEIGYEPWRALVSLSPYDTCMFPTRRSLHIGPADPRDP